MNENTLLQDNNNIRVRGEPLTELPQDLYIPPDALRVLLENFEGPLDLLLYLIKKQNFDILDIPIAEISRQYVHYIDLMSEMELELAAEYLVMAAMLAEIKSKLLLPSPSNSIEDEDEEDPRAELIRRLQEYERYKQVAIQMDHIPRIARDVFVSGVSLPEIKIERVYSEIKIEELAKILTEVLSRANLFSNHKVMTETLSVRERMSRLLEILPVDHFQAISNFYTAEEVKMGVVVTLLAALELLRQAAIELTQTKAFAPIYLKKMG